MRGYKNIFVNTYKNIMKQCYIDNTFVMIMKCRFQVS